MAGFDNSNGNKGFSYLMEHLGRVVWNPTNKDGFLSILIHTNTQDTGRIEEIFLHTETLEQVIRA